MMNTEVVHDGVYKLFLEELAKLDKSWRLPGRVDDNLAGILVAVGILTVMTGVFLSAFVWLPAICVEFVLFFTYEYYTRRLSMYYCEVSRTYLTALAPDACRAFPVTAMVVYGRTKLQIDAGEATYYCGLRTLAESKGQRGWQVVLEQEPTGTSFAILRNWVNSYPGVQ